MWFVINSLTAQAQWTDSGTKITTLDKVGIGTTNPQTTLQVNGTISGNRFATIPYTTNHDYTGEINTALTSYNYVILEAGKTYKLNGTIFINSSQTLEVPIGTTLSYTGSGTAIQMATGSALKGNGKLNLTGKGSQMYKPNTIGILIKGSSCVVDFGGVYNYDQGIVLHGDNAGCGYNRINIGTVWNFRIGIRLWATGNDGWTNSNFIHAQHIACDDDYWKIGSPNYKGQMDPNFPNTYGIAMVGQSPHPLNHNTFSGAIEGVHTGICLVGQYNRLESLRLELPSKSQTDMQEPSISVLVRQSDFFYENVVHGDGSDTQERTHMTTSNMWFGEYSMQTMEYSTQYPYIWYLFFEKNRFVDFVPDSKYLELEREIQMRKALQGFGVTGMGMFVDTVFAHDKAWATLMVRGDGDFINGTVTAQDFNQSSDSTLKRNITDIASGLDKVLQLDGKSFVFKNDTLNILQYGFIAQEVQKIIPELVSYSTDSSTLLLNYDGIIPFLVEGIKMQETKIENLTHSNDSLQTSNDSQGYQISELWNALNELQTEIESLKKTNYGNHNGQTKSAEIDDTQPQVSDLAVLHQNIPNPFDQTTEIAYSLPTNTANASILIFNLQGTLLQNYPLYGIGDGKISISAYDLPAGMYLYSLAVNGNLIDTKRMIINY